MFELEIIGKHDAKNIDTKKRKKTAEDSDEKDDIKRDYNTASLLKRVLETVADMVEECEISASEKGLSIQVMDSMHASISDIFISKSLFDKFRCDRAINIGIKIKDFLKILKNLRFEGDFTFKMNCKDDGNDLTLDYDCEGYHLNFNLTLYTLNLEKYNFPKQEYDVEVELPTRDFLLVPKIVGTFDEHIVIESVDKSLVFRQGGKRTASCLTIKENDDVVVDIRAAIKKEIAMKYVSSIAKAAALSENMKICFGENTPVYFDFGLLDGGYIRFFIAPKVEDEE